MTGLEQVRGLEQVWGWELVPDLGEVAKTAGPKPVRVPGRARGPLRRAGLRLP